MFSIVIHTHNDLVIQETGKVCKSVVVQSAAVGSAVAAEKAGFIQALTDIIAEGIEVDIIATDGHTGIIQHIIFCNNTG